MRGVGVRVRDSMTRRAYRAALIVAGAIALASCSSADSTTDPLQPTGQTASVVITPATTSLVVGATVPLQAQARDASGNVVPSATIYWSSSDTTVATVSASGVVTARAIGTAQIAASAEGHSAIATLSVTAVPVASITVAPSSVNLAIGATGTLSAITYDGSGSPLAGRAVAWTSSAPQIVSVDNSGNITALAAGSATISATSEGKSASATVTVTPIAVASVAVAPTTGTLTVGATMTLTAITYDGNGNTLAGRSIVWASSAPQTATVSTSGVVTAKAAGTATITATSEGKTGSAQITVNAPAPVPVASVVVTPASSQVAVGSSATLTATTRDASGNTLSGRVVTWSTSDAKIATVTTSGVVTAVAAGTVTITATSEGQSGTATVTVPAPATPPPPPPPPATLDTLVVTLSSVLPVMHTNSSITLTVLALDTNGATMKTPPLTWSASPGNIATIKPSGGSSAVLASKGKSGWVTVTVSSGKVHTDIAIYVL